MLAPEGSLRRLAARVALFIALRTNSALAYKLAVRLGYLKKV